ncbi:MAG: hypothetical protein LBS96_02415 [Oscillospiraceae bacterium]|jgi:hypothetical protein|nr:hypothetical protein [Oscillospiraceae bacterium]
MEQHLNYPWEAAAANADAALPYPAPLAEAYQIPAQSPQLPPLAPAFLAAHAVGGDRVTMHWAAVPGAEGYLLLRSEGGNALHPIAVLEETTYIDAALQPGNTYHYAVRAYNANGQSIGAATASVFSAAPAAPQNKTAAEPTPTPEINPATAAAQPTSPPQAQVLVRAMPCGTRQILLEWSPGAGAEEYRLYRSLTPWSSYSLCAETKETRFMDTVETPQTRYYYFVQAVAAGKSSAPSPMVEAVTLPALPDPQQPQHLRATLAGRDSIELRWDRAIGAAAYLICARSNPGEEFHPVGHAAEPVFVHREIPPDSWLEYCVQAYHGSGISRPSLIVSARTPKPLRTRAAPQQRPAAHTAANDPAQENTHAQPNAAPANEATRPPVPPRFPAFSLQALQQGLGVGAPDPRYGAPSAH